MILFSQLSDITGGTILQQSFAGGVTHLLLDSRKAVVDEGAIFLAIKGPHHDGHVYLQDLYRQGIRQFIVEDGVTLPELHNANVIQVASSLLALQQLAAFHRKQFSIPVIGITGSNGKTIIKEWLYQLLSPDLTIVKNPGSYNSQIGVPLSVWQIQPQHQLALFEAGISKPGEMEKLAAIIQPTLGIFTNLGPAHDEGFSGMEEKAAEKLLLFSHSDAVIYCADHEVIHKLMWSSKVKGFSWGSNPEATIKVHATVSGTYTITHEKNDFSLTLPFSDPASTENCLHCIATMLYLKVAPEKIQERINLLRAIPMRLELKEGINHSQLIDDTYNNDLAGLQISLEFLHGQQKKQRSVILSDILESGLQPEVLVTQIASLIAKNNVGHFIGIGPDLKMHHHLFAAGSVFYNTTEEFLENFDVDTLKNEVILVKGARSFQFEKIVNRLQRKVHGTVMEIDLGNVVHNLNFFKAQIKPSTKVMVMVKAFAYGSGSTEIASVLQYHKVDYLGVAYADEGVELRDNNITLPIMVMNPSEESFSTIMAHGLEPEVYNFKILHALISFLNGRQCSIHIKLDTGMHRLGFESKDMEGLIQLLADNSHLRVASVFSHLSGADEPEHDSFSKEQSDVFVRGATLITAAIGYKPLYHLLNSPGILRLPELQFDMVRLGIGLYGVDPTALGFSGLKPVATLKTIISQIKKIKQGETIGYGRRGKAEKEMLLATIAIGYADGFNRAFSRGVGEVLVNGQRAKVVGNVCMDMTMIDITDVAAQEGDEVIIFGKDLPIREVAARINTIPYEILTNASERVKRIFVAESL